MASGPSKPMTGEYLLGATKIALQMLQTVASSIPVPYIGAIVGVASQAITVIEVCCSSSFVPFSNIYLGYPNEPRGRGGFDFDHP